MIIFSPIDPEYFKGLIGYPPFNFTKQIYAFNLFSYDLRFPKVERLIPDSARVGEYAFMNDDSNEFEKAYFHYLDIDEFAFIDMMNIMIKEYFDGSNLIIIEIVENGAFCESVVSSLIKYIYTRYGVKASIVQTLEDLDGVRIENSLFSPKGLILMDNDITTINTICPSLLETK